MGETTEGGPMKFRSPPFPYINLERAIDRAQQLYQVARDHPVFLPGAAKAWAFSPSSSGALQTVAALKHFGLADDEGAGSLRKVRLTKLGLRLVLDKRPDSAERQAALKTAALAPKIHRELWETYGRSLPSSDIVLTALTFERKLAGQTAFSDQSAAELLREYTSTLEFAGLSGDASMSEEGDEPSGGDTDTDADEFYLVPERQAAARQLPPPSSAPAPREVPMVTGERVVFVEEGGPSQYVKLVASGALDEILLDAISDYVERQKRRLKRDRSAAASDEGPPTAEQLPS